MKKALWFLTALVFPWTLEAQLRYPATVVQKHVGEPVTFRWEFPIEKEGEITGFRLYTAYAYAWNYQLEHLEATFDRTQRSYVMPAFMYYRVYRLRAYSDLDNSESEATDDIHVQIIP